MCGKNCVAIASDLRFGINQQQTTAVDMKKIYKIHDHLYVGLSGLATDQMTLAQRFKFRHNLYKLRENRNMKPETFANVVSTMLYEKRFGPYYAEPVVAGLDEDGKPFITGMDLIGGVGWSSNLSPCETPTRLLLTDPAVTRTRSARTRVARAIPARCFVDLFVGFSKGTKLDLTAAGWILRMDPYVKARWRPRITLWCAVTTRRACSACANRCTNLTWSPRSCLR